MSIQEWSERIWVATLADEPALSEGLSNLHDRVEGAEYPADVVLDFSGVSHVNSSNLSQLLRLRKISVDLELKLVIAGPRDSVWVVFMTTGLDKLFDFQPDVPTALTSLQMNN